MNIKISKLRKLKYQTDDDVPVINLKLDSIQVKSAVRKLPVDRTLYGRLVELWENDESQY